MMGNSTLLFPGRLCGYDWKITINLARISIHNFRTQFVRHFDGQICFAASGWATKAYYR
jgi:hypothetical protein